MRRLIASILMALMVLAGGTAIAQSDDGKGAQEQAQQNDVVRASRSVVRVALIGTDSNGNAFFLGHGSGVVIADGYVLTNHHVIEPLQNMGGTMIMIVPSEGDEGFQGQVVDSDPRADLALITTRRGVVRPLPIFTGTPEPTARVAALGYPGNVDLAENLSVDDRVTPLAAVRTFGQLSGGRSRRDVDTLLHTAAIARGNSGGPLVDECGRVIGITSFGAITEGVDAEFGFAVSAREIIPFLRNESITPATTTDSCVPLAERERQAQEAEAEEQSLANRRLAESRQMYLVASVAMLVIGALLIGIGIVAFIYRARLKTKSIPGFVCMGLGLLLMIGSVVVFMQTPSLEDVADAEESET
ncbi:MAG: trypsin-like peptidase domain-containing protein [Parasphingopyxis sp.]|uniref:S1C family serine protease n=1 Tax=Parasphingopyxis sp. TaxID=1920299 RepID=UPI0032EFE0FD